MYVVEECPSFVILIKLMIKLVVQESTNDLAVLVILYLPQAVLTNC